MNLPLFIARRITNAGGNRFTRMIIRIAIIAVALSMAVMIGASALIAGFKTEISQKIFEFWGHIHISDAAYSISFEPNPIDKNQPFYPALDTVKGIDYPLDDQSEAIKSKGGIRHIQVYGHKPGIIRTKTDLEGILLKGIDRDFDWTNLQPYLLEGRPIQFSDTANSRDIIISRQTADRLKVKTGDKFIIHFVKDQDQLRRVFQVCGIYKTGLEEYDRKFALCDIHQVQDLLGWNHNQVAGFEIWLDELQDMEQYNNYLYNEVITNDLLSVPIRDKFPAIFEWLQLQDTNESVILGLMLAVAIINMITALLVLILERSSMIGILKALGSSNGPIRSIFLYQAGIIALKGMFWGNLIALSFCWLQDKFHFIKLKESDYYLSYAPVKLEWINVMAINIGSLLITVLFLILPSLAVAGISPLKVIRFK